MAYDALLDAVNGCLSGIGELPVDNVNDPSLDASMALQVVNRVSRAIQSRGWWFNKEENWALSPSSADGSLAAPVSALSVINVSGQRYTQMAIRNGKIYNVDAHSYDLRSAADTKGKITFSFIMFLDFADLPPVAQSAIARIAKREFAQDLEVDQARWRFQKADEDSAIANLYREDGRNARRNYVRDSPAGKTLNFLTNTNGKPF